MEIGRAGRTEETRGASTLFEEGKDAFCVVLGVFQRGAGSFGKTGLSRNVAAL